MNLPAWGFVGASDLAHLAQGTGLLLFAIAQGVKPGGKYSRALAAAAPAGLALAGLGVIFAVMHHVAGWSLSQLNSALAAKPGFHLFPALGLLFLSAALASLLGGSSRFWNRASLGLLAAIGAVYSLFGFRVSPAAALESGVYHGAMAATLLGAAAVRAWALYRPSRAGRGLELAWIVLLFMTSFQLLVYRENPDAYAFRLVSLETAPPARPGKTAAPAAPGPKAPAKNAPADKERSRR